jgi:hypothetical protein
MADLAEPMNEGFTINQVHIKFGLSLTLKINAIFLVYNYIVGEVGAAGACITNPCLGIKAIAL